MKLSVVLATFNEEQNIGKCLDAVKIADEIIIVDGGSIDKTREVAKKYNAKITVTDNPPIFHVNKQKAVDLATGEWILQLDADEVVTPELWNEINSKIQNTSYAGFFIKRKNFFLNTWLRKGGQYPDPVIRLFKKGKGRFPCKSVHEQISIDGLTGILDNDLLHFTAPTLSRYLVNSNRYTSLTAAEYAEKKVGLGIFTKIKYLLLKPFYTFCLLYFRHKGILDGFPGFMFAYFSGMHVFTSYIKYWESEKKEKV